MFFVSLGAVYASDADNVTIDNSNLIQDDSMLSSYNLEVSSNNSISENNLISSHNDNLIENSSSSSESYDENINNDNSSYVEEDYPINVETDLLSTENDIYYYDFLKIDGNSFSISNKKMYLKDELKIRCYYEDISKDILIEKEFLVSLGGLS